MEIVKTICPRCFKVFSVSEEVDRVRCNFCEYDYELPRFIAGDNIDKESGFYANKYMS